MIPQPAILQTHIPFDAHGNAKLPGVQPLDMADWLIRDEVFGAQVALKQRLLAQQTDAVLARVAGCGPAENELCEVVATALADQFGIAAAPTCLEDLAGLCQEDFVIMDKQGDEHVMVAACLTFPASWTLAEKIGRPLVAIHEPVETYTPEVARRVQRLFDGIQVGRPLWRWNHLWYQDPALFQPRQQGVTRQKPEAGHGFFRTERQCLVRLPKTRAVVFSIHTWVVAA